MSSDPGGHSPGVKCKFCGGREYDGHQCDQMRDGFIVKRRGAIGTARANFMCNSQTCATKKGARVYDLPAASVKCPVCSKKLTKLMSVPNISRGIAKQSDKLLEPQYTRQRQQRDEAKAKQKEAPMIAVDARQGLAAAVQQGMARAGYGHIPVPVPAASLGQARPTPRITTPEIAGIMAAGAARGPRPDASTRRYAPTPDEVAQARREA